jgi:Lon protease-like protein
MIGNATYRGPGDLPPTIPVFPLTGALLLPRGQLPLNIFEPRYVAMVDAALAGDRVIGMVQPRLDGGVLSGRDPALCAVGCAGRLTSFSETGDGRYLISLTGIARFRLVEEVRTGTPYRMARIDASDFADDFVARAGEDAVDRAGLIKAFRVYLDANNLEADWDSVSRASTETLVNALSMMSPFGPPEKQALLEAPDLKTRAATLVAIAEIAARSGGDETPLQ